jgi:hypothetical protein
MLALVIAGLFSQAAMAETQDGTTTVAMTETADSTTTMDVSETPDDSTATADMTDTLVEEGAVIDSTSTANDTHAISKISNDFSGLLGESATEVVSGLRSGEEFTLTNTYTDADGVQVTETVVIEPPTGHMGNGNVFITLGLAQHNLSQLGITEPGAIDLEAALLGGSITTSDGQVIELEGVLALRSEGMGWGEIAQQYDTKLGHVMSGLKSGKVYSAPTTVSSGSTTGDVSTTDTADTATTRNARGASPKIKTTHVSNGHGYGRGIVTAGGSSIGSIAAGNSQAVKSHGQGNAYGHAPAGGQGIVSAGGGAVHGNAGGNGNGKALGKLK